MTEDCFYRIHFISLLQAYVTICDLLIVFSKHLANIAVIEVLCYDPDKNLQAQLSGFLNDKVFIEDEDGK